MCMMMGFAPVTSHRVAYCATSLAAVFAVDVVTVDVVAAEIVGTSAAKTLLMRWSAGSQNIPLISSCNAARITGVVQSGLRCSRGQTREQLHVKGTEILVGNT